MLRGDPEETVRPMTDFMPKFIEHLQQHTQLPYIILGLVLCLILLLMRRFKLIAVLVLAYFYLQGAVFMLGNDYTNFDHPWPFIGLVVIGGAFFLMFLYWTLLRPGSE